MNRMAVMFSGGVFDPCFSTYFFVVSNSNCNPTLRLQVLPSLFPRQLDRESMAGRDSGFPFLVGN